MIRYFHERSLDTHWKEMLLEYIKDFNVEIKMSATRVFCKCIRYYSVQEKR